MKIYDHDDFSEWSFIESEAEQVEKEHVLDDGGLVLDADQEERLHLLAHMCKIICQNVSKQKKTNLVIIKTA